MDISLGSNNPHFLLARSRAHQFHRNPQVVPGWSGRPVRASGSRWREKNKRLKGFLECTESDFSSGGRETSELPLQDNSKCGPRPPQQGSPQGTSHLVPGLSQHGQAGAESGHLGCGHKGPCLLGHLFRDKERKHTSPGIGVREQTQSQKDSCQIHRSSCDPVTGARSPHRTPPGPSHVRAHTHTLTPMFPRLPGT